MNREVGKRTAQHRVDHIARSAPELSFFDIAVDDKETIFLEQFQAKVMVEKTKEWIGRTTMGVVMRLPLWHEAAAKWVAQLENGRYVLEIDARDIDQQMDELKQSGSKCSPSGNYADIDRNVGEFSHFQQCARNN